MPPWGPIKRKDLVAIFVRLVSRVRTLEGNISTWSKG
jgi:hypothetical protein